MRIQAIRDVPLFKVQNTSTHSTKETQVHKLVLNKIKPSKTLNNKSMLSMPKLLITTTKQKMEFSSILSSSACYSKRWPEVCFVFLCFLSIRWYFKHKNQFIVNWPIVGALPVILRSPHSLNEGLADVLHMIGGGSTKLRGLIFTGMEYLLTCHPDNIEYILKTNFSNFQKGPAFREIFDVFGDAMIAADSDSWLAQRKMAHSRLSSKDFRKFYSNVSRNVVDDALIPLFTHLASEVSVVDLQDVFLRFTHDTSFTIVSGRNPKYLSVGFPSNKLAEAVQDVSEAIIFRHMVASVWWKSLRWLRIGKERRLAKAWQTIDRHIAEMISLKREELLKGVNANDLMSMYMNSHGGESDKFIRDTALFFFGAARDTSASGLTWFFWLISKTPRVEARILEELNHVSSKSRCDLEEIKELVYLHAALCESLRLYPPVYLNHKCVLTEDVLPDGTRVKPGMSIILSIYAAARMEWIWGKDCTEFVPERWIDENGKLRSELLSKFFIFNAGPRTCMGKDMAFTMMKSAAAAILFNFHVEVVQDSPHSQKLSPVLLMENGLKVKIRERVA